MRLKTTAMAWDGTAYMRMWGRCEAEKAENTKMMTTLLTPRSRAPPPPHPLFVFCGGIGNDSGIEILNLIGGG